MPISKPLGETLFIWKIGDSGLAHVNARELDAQCTQEMGVAIQSPPFPPLSPESPHLWEGMGEFSSCQRHFWTMCIRKRNWRGTLCPVGIAPAAKHPQHPSEEWIQVRHQDCPFHWHPHWSQGHTAFPRGAQNCSPGWVATLWNSRLSTCPTGLTGTLLLREFSLQCYDVGGSLSVSWHSLFLRSFSWWVHSFLFEVQKKEDWVTNRSPAVSHLSLTLQLFPIILKCMLRTSYMQSLLTFPLILSHWIITTC